MSYRFMRVMVFFDLPTLTSADKRQYRQFRKNLIKNGFIMLQESVYCRMVLNASVEKSVMDVLKQIKPQTGLVQVLTVTEKQFSKMEFLTGERSSDTIASDERLVIL